MHAGLGPAIASPEEETAVSEDLGQSALGLRLIGGFKFVCGLLLVGLGVGLIRGVGGNLGDEAEHLVAALKLDPDSRYIHSLIAKVTNVTPGQLRALGVGTFLYALLYLVEGTGLLLRKPWAEYLTVVATGLFIPLEIYEVARRVTPIRITLLVVNAAILVYVIRQIRRKGRATSSPIT
jgi:uncharacterized membrane protein (DUF2068 family)